MKLFPDGVHAAGDDKLLTDQSCRWLIHRLGQIEKGLVFDPIRISGINDEIEFILDGGGEMRVISTDGSAGE